MKIDTKPIHLEVSIKEHRTIKRLAVHLDLTMKELLLRGVNLMMEKNAEKLEEG